MANKLIHGVCRNCAKRTLLNADTRECIDTKKCIERGNRKDY